MAATAGHPTGTLSEHLAHVVDARRSRLADLWEMSTPERVAAMRRGALTYEQLAAWSARHPEQVPTLNGEFEWLAARTPEACE